MIRLYAYVGDVNEDQLDFLVDNLEEEWSDDKDYYLNAAMIDGLETKGADNELVGLLRKALNGNEDVEVLWVDTEELEFEEDEEEA